MIYAVVDTNVLVSALWTKNDQIIAYVKEHGVHSERVPYDEQMPDEDDRVFYEVAFEQGGCLSGDGQSEAFPSFAYCGDSGRAAGDIVGEW